MNKLKNLLTICLIVIGASISVNAQTPSPTPTADSSKIIDAIQNLNVQRSAIPSNLQNDEFVQKLLIQLDYETKLRLQAEKNAEDWKQQAQRNLDIANKEAQRADKLEKAWAEERAAGLTDNKANLILQSQNSELIKDNTQLQLENNRLRKDRWKYGLVGAGLGVTGCMLYNIK